MMPITNVHIEHAQDYFWTKTPDQVKALLQQYGFRPMPQQRVKEEALWGLRRVANISIMTVQCVGNEFEAIIETDSPHVAAILAEHCII
jgi:hypothetical protein